MPSSKISKTNKPFIKLISKLPSDILQHTLFGYFNTNEDKFILAELAQYPNFNTIDEYKSIRKNIKQNLWQHIVCGEEKAAEIIISKIPQFLLSKLDIKDKADRTIKNVTPLQLAWHAEDVSMVKMILPYLKTLKNNGDIAEEITERAESKQPKEKPYD